VAKVRRRLLWWMVPAVLLMLLVGAAYRSGRQEPIDVVAETAKRLGVALESRTVVGNGVLLHVVEAGPKDGPPVVLLHGYPEFWWGWNQQIARLARAGFHVIAPDQRGYDASDKPKDIEDYRVDLLVGDIIALILHLRYESVYLAGHDWGGAIAWRLAINYPERVRKLVMFNAPHPLAWLDAQNDAASEKAISWFRTFFQLPWLPEIGTRMANWRLVEKNLRDTSRPGTFSDRDMAYYKYAWDRDGAMHSMINWYRAAFRYPPTIAGSGVVEVPTRLVWGMQDRFFPSNLAALSIRHCTHGTLVEVPNAGHWLLHEEPDLTSQQMIDFFSSQAPAS